MDFQDLATTLQTFVWAPLQSFMMHVWKWKHEHPFLNRFQQLTRSVFKKLQMWVKRQSLLWTMQTVRLRFVTLNFFWWERSFNEKEEQGIPVWRGQKVQRSYCNNCCIHNKSLGLSVKKKWLCLRSQWRQKQCQRARFSRKQTQTTLLKFTRQPKRACAT